jgi:microcin C transport system substrate-binding protein
MVRYGLLIIGMVALFASARVYASNGAAQPTSRAAIAMHGEPKYATDFKHFDYVNPDAPQGGTLKLGVAGTFDSLNPFIVRGNPPQTPAFDIKGAVYETLMARSWDEPFTLYGLIAETVEVPDDRSSITFNLNPKAHWQDGKPVTADDVLFSFTTLRDKGRPNHRTYYRKIDKAEKLGDRKIRFTFTPEKNGNVDREMPLIMGLMPILPKHEWPQNGKEAREFNETTLRIPLASGPYKITKVDPGRSLVMTKDPDYWGKNVPAQQGMYNFDTIHFDFYRDDSIALQAFKAGQFDLRREPDPNKWKLAYEGNTLKEGRIKLETFPHQRTEAAYGFITNTRRPLLQDKVLREALDLALDFDWINRSLFHGLYRRTESYFPNSELAAPSNGSAALRGGADGSAGSHPGANERENLLKAAEKLKTAGYTTKNDILRTPQGTPVEFEILLSDPAEEKVALEWTRALKRIGIAARVRTVDSAQYQARLTNFDFDVTTGRWFNSLSPGNEQIYFWGSAAAGQPGSRNYTGIRDPAIDALASSIPEAKTREELVAKTRALDRALITGHYAVLLYHLGVDQIAYAPKRIEHPNITPLYGPILETWWSAATAEP